MNGLTAVRADSEPSLLDLGPMTGLQELYADVPYGVLVVVHHTQADEYMMRTSEHTDLDATAAMMRLMPETAGYVSTAQCPRVPVDFKNEAHTVWLHTFISFRRGVALARIAPAFFFSTKIVG